MELRRRSRLGGVRQLPVEGAEVTIVYLAVTEAGVIAAVEDAGHTLEVEALSGERLRFRLNATGWFVTADRAARLQLGGDAPE